MKRIKTASGRIKVTRDVGGAQMTEGDKVLVPLEGTRRESTLAVTSTISSPHYYCFPCLPTKSRKIS